MLHPTSKVILFLGVLIASCTVPPKTYLGTIAIPHNVQERGDVDIQGSLAPNHVQAGIAYSPVRYVQVQSQVLGTLRGGGVYELGLGGYVGLARDSRLGLSAGYGQGSLTQSAGLLCFFSNNPNCQSYRVNTNFDKSYFQLDYRAKISPDMSVGLIYRKSFVNFSDYEFFQSNPETNSVETLEEELLYQNLGLFVHHEFKDRDWGLSLHFQAHSLMNSDLEHVPISEIGFASVLLSYSPKW